MQLAARRAVRIASHRLALLFLVAAGACSSNADDLTDACGPNGECPPNLICDRSSRVCRAADTRAADGGGSDATRVDAGSPDASSPADAAPPDAPPRPAALVLTPRSQDFGMLVVGETGQPLTFTVDNTGDAPSGPITASLDDTTSFALAGGTCGDAPLPGGGRCTVLVTFHPTSTAPAAATLTVTAAPGGSQTATLSGRGLTPGALSLTGAGGFGRQPIGAPSGESTFTLRNTGGAPTGTLSVGLTDGRSFAISRNDCPVTLGAGTSCAIGVTFTPAQVGIVQGVSLTASATPGGAVAAELSGTGTAAVKLTLQGSGAVASTPPGLACTSSCTAVFDSSPVRLAATPSPTFTFDAWSGACSGSRACDVTLSAATVEVTARFDVIPASLEVTPPAQTFGPVVLGGSSDAVGFTVKNVGGATTAALAATVDDDAYQLTGSCAGAHLAAGKTCTVSVTFAPTGAAGPRPATLTVAASGGPETTASLNGTALVPGALELTPTAHDFGDQPLASATTGVRFTVTNKGEAPTGRPAASLSDATHFQLLTSSCVAALAPGESCTVDVAFKPAAVGAVRGVTLAVAALPGGDATAALSGTGTADVALKNAGGGAVRSTPAGLDCTGDCTVTFTSTPVDLVAAPDGLHTFGGWSGACSGSGECRVDLTAAVNPVTARFDLKPAAVALAPGNQGFGSIVLGGSSAKIPFTVSNGGGVASGPLATGASDASFVISDDRCAGVALAPGASCTLNVAFAPTGQAGAKQATLEVSGTPGGRATSTLTGTALTPGALTITPTTTSFAATRIGSTSAATELTVKNSGGAPTGVPGVSLSDATHFTITSNLCTAALAAGATCKVKVAFAPKSVGNKQGVTLNVTATPGGTASTGVNGTGTAQVTVAAPLVGGTVTSSDGSIACAPTCAADFGAAPTLTAHPDGAHTFGGWSGAGCGGTGTCQPTLTLATQEVTATFAAIPACQFVTVDTFAGDGRKLTLDGQGLNASFTLPAGITVDPNGILYVEDVGAFRRITADATVSTLQPLFPPLADGIVTDGTHIYQAARSFANSFVFAATLTSPGNWTGAVLSGGLDGFMDGPANVARFSFRSGLAQVGDHIVSDVMLGADGAIIVSDTGNRRIRRVALDGTASTLAGDGTTGSGVLGPAGMTLDASGRVVFADLSAHVIRRIETNGTITTIAGDGTVGSRDGAGDQAQFSLPRGVVFDAAGNLYVTDIGNHRVRRIAPDRTVDTVAGGAEGYSAGATSGCNALFDFPWGVVVRNDTLFITDWNNNRIRRITLP